MFITKQKDYDKFICTGSACPDNCCHGWQIMIDDESVCKYKELGETDNRVKKSVDLNGQAFKQINRNCCFLDSDGLCYLQRNYGEDALCVTCKSFPRHIEEFEGVREYSLSISCPEVARFAVKDKEPMTFIDIEDVEEDEEFEDFDFLLYDKLVSIREVLFTIAKDRGLSLFKRLDIIQKAGEEIQRLVDEDEIFEIDDYIEQLKDGYNKDKAQPFIDIDVEKRMFSVLYELEMLQRGWNIEVDKAWECIFKSEDGIDKLLKFSYEHETAGENLLVFFIYTYFCGAVYDGWISSKTALASYSVKWIFMIALAKVLCGEEEDPDEALIKAAYRYAREAEHSDINLDKLEEMFMNNN